MTERVEPPGTERSTAESNAAALFDDGSEPHLRPSEEDHGTRERPPRLEHRTQSSTSYVTASEVPVQPVSPSAEQTEEELRNGDDEAPQKAQRRVEDEDTEPARTSTITNSTGNDVEVAESSRSTSKLLQRADGPTTEPSQGVGKLSAAKDAVSRVVTRLKTPNQTEDQGDLRNKSTLRGLVRFDIPEDSRRAELQARAHMTLRRASTKLRRSRLKDGLIVKMERMLVRVDLTTNQLPEEYNENESQGVESRTTEKWREYMVVCRQSTKDDADYTLQMYKSRVIPAVEEGKTKKRAKHEILLGRKISKVNLYSSLDKTIVVWVPGQSRTAIYILQPRSSSNASEWYTFLRNILGWSRSSELQINVPDMGVNLLIDKPFESLENPNDVMGAADGDDEALQRTMQKEQAVAKKLVDRCMATLAKSPEWADILDVWAQDRVGLCWKRYDRLEWIYGANERKMYGTIAMLKTHDLELRVKQHYPTEVPNKKHGHVQEPTPVEGFLVRLTSQKGGTRRLGMMFFKRLYFSSYDQYLVFCRPAKAWPPPPPRLPTTDDEEGVPSAEEIEHNVPLIYPVNPYPVENGEISWLRDSHSSTTEDQRLHDQEAYEEELRKEHMLLNCEGYINLCDVKKVRNMHRGATMADEQLDDGSDVEFDADVPDTNREDGVTTEVDDDRTFELVMKNELVIRLQASEVATKKEWMKHLRHLIKYWKHRTGADVQLLKSVRLQNLEQLRIDEETEAYVGQFARKWEVSHSYASPERYNLCGISSCRTIHLSGSLYRKPRRHSSFTRCSVMLCSGKLLVFQDVLRSTWGKLVPHIHHERISSLDLRDCYLYSGLLTESELLYQNRTFDSNKPGHHALPRVYLEDGWTSTDEDVMTCFVLWHGKRRSWFRSVKDGDTGGGEQGAGTGTGSRIKLVSQLGVPGRSVVFRARSRAERDRWVLAIQTEIERMMEEEDFRITESKQGATKQTHSEQNGATS